MFFTFRISTTISAFIINHSFIEQVGTHHCSVVIVLIAFRYLFKIWFLRPHLTSFHIVHHILSSVHSFGIAGSGCTCCLACGRSEGTTLRLIVWFVFKDFADADGLSFVSQRESAHLLNDIKFLERDRALSSNTTNYSRLTSDKLWLLFFGDFATIILFP